MGVVLAFPSWRVVCRAEANGRGEPSALVDPAGRLHAIQEILRRRLVASREPTVPLRHEIEVRAAGGTFRLCCSEPGGRWTVEPL